MTTRREIDEALCAAIGRMIRARREALAMTRYELGSAIGLSGDHAPGESCSANVSVWRAEAGRQRFTIPTLYRYAEALGVDIKELLP